MTSWDFLKETDRFCERLKSELGISEKHRDDAVDALCNTHVYTSTMSTASCVMPRLSGKTAAWDILMDKERVVNNAKTLISYARNLARFKPSDVVYTTTQWIIPRVPCKIYPKGTEGVVGIVADGYAQVFTNDGEMLCIPLDCITHLKPTERKEKDMGTGNTHEVWFRAINSFDFKPRKILKSWSKRKNTNTTIVFWNDGTKTIVKRAKDEPDNTYAAFTAALAIKLFGSNSALKKYIEKHTEEQNAKKE